MTAGGCDALFNSPCFLFGFLPLVLAAYWLVPFTRWRHSVLLVSGLLFYGLWDVRFSVLLVVAGIVDYGLALGLARSARRGRWLAASIVFNLGLLAFFKYAMFAADSARSLLTLVGSPLTLPYFHIVLPLGISFFTFKTLSYTVDVYRREVEPTRDLVKYLAFITMFPDVVAGPIVRYREVSQQLDTLPRWLAPATVATGLLLFATGLFKKVVVADTIAGLTSYHWSLAHLLTGPEAWLAMLGFAVQLYFDFSGYSDMAMGLACLLGLRFPVNFNAPYQALDPSDFWRRWHMSLSTWLRDYLYIPLGGNRARGIRVSFNLLAVMVLGGLWHGAGLTFLAWGAYHGLLLVAYKHGRTGWDALPRLVRQLAMVLLVSLGWVLFRASDLASALAVYRALLQPFTWAAVEPVLLDLLVVGGVLAFTLVAAPSAALRAKPRPSQAAVVALCLGVALLFVLQAGPSPFLYYQF